MGFEFQLYFLSKCGDLTIIICAEIYVQTKLAVTLLLEFIKAKNLENGTFALVATDYSKKTLLWYATK